MVSEYQKSAFLTIGSSSSFIKIYSYKPAIYLVLAAYMHMKRKSFGAIWLLVHGSAIALINQWDINQGVKKLNVDKWN